MLPKKKKKREEKVEWSGVGEHRRWFCLKNRALFCNKLLFLLLFLCNGEKAVDLFAIDNVTSRKKTKQTNNSGIYPQSVSQIEKQRPVRSIVLLCFFVL